MCGFFAEGKGEGRRVRVMEGVIERRRSWVVFCGLSICEGELAAGGGGGGGTYE